MRRQNEKKAKENASKNAKIVQSEVKLRLQEWIQGGIVEEELKNIISSPSAKDSDKLKAIEVLTKLAGFEQAPAKIAATDAEGNDLVRTASFDELKVLWMNELKRETQASIDENVQFLREATDEEIDAMIAEANEEE